MSKRAHGRGAIAAIGLLVLFAGLVGGVVLWVVAAREPNNTAEGFARAAPGCTTTVTFSEAGEYYVFEELSGVVATVEGCEATTTPGQAFAFDIRPPGGEPIDRITDTSVSYDLDAGVGNSVARISIDVPGDYAVSVLGNDPAINAAIGDDPDEGVDRLRRAAIAAVIVGIVVGGLLLWLAGRRSRKAATFTSPVDPGWGVTERDRQRRAAAAADRAEWAAPVSGSQQVPVNPHQPDERRTVAPADPTADGVWASPPESDLPEPVLAGVTPANVDGADHDDPSADPADSGDQKRSGDPTGAIDSDDQADPVATDHDDSDDQADPVATDHDDSDDQADPVAAERDNSESAVDPVDADEPVDSGGSMEQVDSDEDVDSGGSMEQADSADPIDSDDHADDSNGRGAPEGSDDDRS
jgi:hypothetical protein